MNNIQNFIEEKIPWLSDVLLIIAILLVLVLLIVTITKVLKGEAEFSIFGIKFSNNRAYDKLQKQFNELNEHSSHQQQVIMFLFQVNKTVSDTGKLTRDKFQEGVSSFYDLFFGGIINILNTSKGNSFRVAILYKATDGLRILHGIGYSPDGKSNLCLGLNNTKAGYCYTNNEIVHYDKLSNDPTFKRNPHSSKKNYESLICVPIIYNKEVIGVLNVDAYKENSFNTDDKDYLTYFATSLSPLLYKEFLYRDIKDQLDTSDKEVRKRNV
ncbi:GAF domain-containing protein [Oceanobacillus manasiensis]|uniref:GAF domain-containing protein n=1 Tax=Oceanobacillus manasiensis TaxID=586413 RepID=UPI0005A846AD|nr:GAF domain-containing protein [Oceanobacillus manasiensis]